MIFTILLPTLLITGGLIITGVGVAAQNHAVSRADSQAARSQTTDDGNAMIQPPTDPLLLADIPTVTPQPQLAFQAKIDWDLDNVSYLVNVM